MLQTELDQNFSFNNTSDSEAVVRKFINRAIYVESSMPPCRQNSPFSKKSIKIKRCVCATNKENCECHPENDCENAEEERNTAYSSSGSSNSMTTVRENKHLNTTKNEFRLSLTSLATNATSQYKIDDREREKIFREWLAKKKKEKLEQQLREEKMRKLQETERERQLELQREHFRKWLENKKKEEEKMRQEKLKQLEMETFQEKMKEKRSLENEISFQYWLKRKEKDCLEKKLRDKIKILEAAQERQKRLEESAKAYEEWLKNSKYKPKPIPLNQGLDSLRASVSVTYVNPTPWVAPDSSDRRNKPASQ